MEFIEVSAKTYDEAVTDALVQLGATSEQVEIEVIDEGKAGFLGIGRTNQGRYASTGEYGYSE